MKKKQSCRLVAKTYPDIDVEIAAYAGANRIGYSWAQMIISADMARGAKDCIS
ncbi:MAG: hypothetical protein NC081_03780 [Roseburia sp.]|nr:hypothetical protein [Roseburia sp.]